MLKYLNEISEDELKKIKNLASLFFTPKEIAIMMEFSTDLFPIIVRAGDSEIQNFPEAHRQIYNAFHSGRLQAEVDLRTCILKLAKSGSSPAQTMAMDLLNKSKIKMLDR